MGSVYKPKTLCAHQRQAIRDGASTEPLESSGPEPCIQCKTESRRALNYRLKLIAGLLMPFALQALDVTIVASALPFIAIDFDEVAELNWIVSAFNLTSAAFIPFWGQMADIFGRHTSLQAVLILMTIGSALCTGAPTSSFPVLLLGRGFQGVACAGISVLVRVIIADKVTLQENAKNWSFFALTGGLSYAIGPVIGGYLTAASWRWCFAINLPICVLGIAVIFFVLREELVGPQPLHGVDDDAVVTNPKATISRRLMTIDIGGQLLFLFGFGLMILAFTWAGSTYGWVSVEVLVPLILGAVVFAGWLFYEYMMVPERALGQKLWFQKPMVPWHLILNRNVGLLFYINFATGMAMYSVNLSPPILVLYFVDLYFTLILGYSASKAGVQLLYYTPGIGGGVYAAMVFCNVWPRNTFLPLFLGSTIEAVGIGLLAWAMYTGKTGTIYGMIAFSGVGTGLRFMPGTLHAVGFFPKSIATIVSLMGIALPFGGALSLTIMTTVYNNLIAEDARMAFVWAFVAICPFMGICIVCAACLGNVGIVKPKPGEEGQSRRSSSSQANPGIGGREKPSPMAVARPSSSIILLSPTNQVLLLHRVQTSTSFPSAHVFPGGNISPFHESGCPLPPPGSPDRHRDSPAYRLAAIRETFEDNPLLTVPEADREEARRQVHGDVLNFQDWVRRDLGGTLCVDELVPFTRWVTPPNMPKRFTTQMYLFLMPPLGPAAPAGDGAVGVDVDADVDVVQTPTPDGGIEHTAATFADAGEWLRRQDRGEIVLFPPQCYLLALVAEMLGSVPLREGGGGGGGDHARYVAQRKALLDFVGRAPASAEVGLAAESRRGPHPTALIPWSEKVMSPQTLFIRDSDRRIVLGIDKPGPELKGSGRGGDFERVVLVKFTKQGPTRVEVRNREDVLQEEKEVKGKREAAKL
ncbi:hypothetical protein VMCG_08659 [Cytospora schulzeri]|uniref:Major facilitator superfamily (MFS) profile domain-containing protein n=1 Tax=Cytospora schulzeri TaxID=448051 RepID=A0A423VTQ4_9PEZI|nr:hypothetical protein VMCG_08659 [Valsa malicola]